MKSDYWDVTDEQVMEKTGKPLAHWDQVLERFGVPGRKSNDVVSHLQNDHGVPRYWARTLTTRYLRKAGQALAGLFVLTSGAVDGCAGTG